MNDSPSYGDILNDLRPLYDSLAQERSRGKVYPWKSEERRRFLHELRLGAKTSLLDLGAGHGSDGYYFARCGLSVACVDLSARMVELCRRKGLEAWQADFLHLPFEEGRRFDAAYSMNALLHLPSQHLEEFLCRLRGLLAPGGLFYYGVYGGVRFEGIWEEDACVQKRFFNYYTDEEILALGARHFRLLYFHRVAVERRKGLHFQSMIWAAE